MSKPVVLPPSCPLCAPEGGYWTRAANGGLRRCGCPRGRILAQLRPSTGHSTVRPAVRDGKSKGAGE